MANLDLWMQLKDYREIPDGEPTDREIIALLVDEILGLRTEVKELQSQMEQLGSRVDCLYADEEGIVRG